jgi:hypothetical protein
VQVLTKWIKTPSKCYYIPNREKGAESTTIATEIHHYLGISNVPKNKFVMGK